MKALRTGYHLPVVLALCAVFFLSMIARDLGTGAIWRGGPEPTITVAGDPVSFYSMIAFFAVMALIFLGGAVWSLVLLRRKKR